MRWRPRDQAAAAATPDERLPHGAGPAPVPPPIAYDVDYMYKGMKYRSRLPDDPGNRLRVAFR